VLKSYADKVDSKKVSAQDLEQLKLYVLLGIKVQTVTQLNDIKEHAAVAKLIEKESSFGVLLSSLVSEPPKQIGALFQKHSAVLKRVGCSLEQLTKKKQYLELSKLSKSEYSFSELSAILGV